MDAAAAHAPCAQLPALLGTGSPPHRPSFTRTHHRAETHLVYRCTPLPTGEVLWSTPHGLHRLVDNAGTHTLDPHDADGWASEHPLDRHLTRILHQHRTGQVESLDGPERP